MTKKMDKPSRDEFPFRRVLQRLMDERGLNVAQVGVLAGVPRATVQEWLAGRSPRDLPAVGRLARTLGVSLRVLLLDEEEESQPEAAVFDSDPLAAFEEQDFIDGVFRVRFQRLVPRKPKKGR